MERALQQVGLEGEGLRERSPFQLSAGQQRLAAIAAVLAMQPGALMLDEPTAGLDQSAQQRLFTLLQQLNLSGQTIIVVTHRLDQIVSLSDHLIVLNRGTLLVEGKPDNIFSQPELLHRYGLYLPPVMELMKELIAAGLPFPPALYSLEETRQEIVAWRNRGFKP